jgi:hypothetical protein
MRSFTSKAGWVIAALLGITLIAAWAGVINAGTLDPPGPLGPTMKSLDDIPGSWHRVLTGDDSSPCANERFRCVMSDDAVLDNETGLVWERQPSIDAKDFQSAIRACHTVSIGNRYGWRLPTISELMTLADASTIDGFPGGHPFVLPVTDIFWSSTVDPTSSTRGFRVDFDQKAATDDPQETAWNYWCVRAPSGPDNQ